MSTRKKIAVVSGAAAVAGAAVAAGRHKAAAADEPPEADPTSFDQPPREETKEELYERAKALKIRGRSRMTKEELRRAVAQGTPEATA
jgi:hypothetical protein